MNNKVNNNSNINNNLNYNLDKNNQLLVVTDEINCSDSDGNKNNQSSERLISSPEQVVTPDNPNEKAQTKKKKKKKFKSLISEIISGHKKDELTEKEEHLEKIKKSLGGGNFKKVDKI